MSGNAAVPEPPAESGLGARELEAAHEIAQAFLAATQPIEVYRLALARLTPMVRADFAAVFLREEVDTELLRPVCLHGWPQASARYIGQMRIRVGLGPTGRAVARNEPVEVADIFATDNLEDWHTPARELGFASMTTLPLATQTSVNGAISFYYAEPHTFNDDERRLLRLISEQLAATTTRARVLDELRVENERLRRDGEHLAAAIRDAEVQARQHDRLVASVAHELLDSRPQNESTRGAMSANGTTPSGVARLVPHLLELLELRLGRVEIMAAAEDAVRLAYRAVEASGAPPMGARFDIDVGDTIMPVTTDGPRVVRIIATMLADAYRRTARGEIRLTIAVSKDETGQWVDWTVTGRGLAVDAGGLSGRDSAGTGGSDDLQTTIADMSAQALGGEITGSSEMGNGWWQRLRLPVRREDPSAGSAGRALG